MMVSNNKDNSKEYKKEYSEKDMNERAGSSILMDDKLRGFVFKERHYEMLDAIGLTGEPLLDYNFDIVEEVIMKALSPYYMKKTNGVILTTSPRGNGGGFFTKKT